MQPLSRALIASCALIRVHSWQGPREVQRSRKLSTSQPLKLLTGWVQIAWHAMSSIPLALPLRCADASKFFASYIAATARSHFFCITPARSCPSVVAASILNELWLNSQHLSFELEPQSRLLQYTTWFIRRRAPPRRAQTHSVPCTSHEPKAGYAVLSD